MPMIENVKCGIKVSVISTLDYDDFREILDAIKLKGYKVIMADNGNAICEKVIKDV